MAASEMSEKMGLPEKQQSEHLTADAELSALLETLDALGAKDGDIAYHDYQRALVICYPLLRERLSAALEEVTEARKLANKLEQKAEAAESKLSAVRKETIEECARVCGMIYATAPRANAAAGACVRAIRSLPDAPGTTKEQK